MCLNYRGENQTLRDPNEPLQPDFPLGSTEDVWSGHTKTADSGLFCQGEK